MPKPIARRITQGPDQKSEPHSFQPGAGAMSPFGPSATSLDVRRLIAIGGKADESHGSKATLMTRSCQSAPSLFAGAPGQLRPRRSFDYTALPRLALFQLKRNPDPQPALGLFVRARNRPCFKPRRADEHAFYQGALNLNRDVARPERQSADMIKA